MRYAALRRSSIYCASFARAGQKAEQGKQKLEQLPLQLAIAFFALIVASWAALGLYLRAERQRRLNAMPIIEIVTEAPVAQAA
jgi:hypothetical protein